MTIYVGNISHGANEQDLTELFSNFGEVTSLKIIKDNFTGKSRGFAFVDMEDENATNAIQSLNETEFMGRQLVVNQAKPKERSEGSGGYKPRFNQNRGNSGGNRGGSGGPGGSGGFNKRY